MSTITPSLSLTIFSCARSSLPNLDTPDYHIDCSHLRPPSAQLRKAMNGTDAPFRRAFFSDAEAHDALDLHLADLFASLQHLRRTQGGGLLTIMVYCLLGVHRSVAMAETLGKRARHWPGVNVVVSHLDLHRNWARYQKDH
ncbi:hypothetical protein MMC11_006588 [Xylographa trunciseda]|nr:hypothetical protein [Xylographa trunciseda]